MRCSHRRGAVRPGERVSVLLPLTGSEQALVVPTAAVVYDMNGGAWVYEATGADHVRAPADRDPIAGWRQDPGHPRHRRRKEGRHGRRRRAVRHRVRGRQVACAGSSRSRCATRSSSWRWPRSARSRPHAARATFRSTSFRSSRRRSSKFRPKRRASRRRKSKSLVSVPIESALAGVPGVKTIRSKSVLGLSSVVLILDADADRMEARQHVQERLGTIASQLPVTRASAGDAGAAVVAQPLDEDRHHVADAVADGDDDARPLDGAAAIDGGAGRRQRRDLGAARPAAAGARRSGSPRTPTTSRSTRW